MPSYKTHSIHGEIVLSKMNKKNDLNIEDIKTFCIGPDTLILTDNKTFEMQHANNVKEYFKYMLSYIKTYRLQENKEVMAFLYGQLDHYILDTITHPLIYHNTEFINNNYKIEMHGLVEMWLDNYIIDLYNINNNNYYKKNKINSDELLKLINILYTTIYNKNNEAVKYQLGILSLKTFDELVRNNKTLVANKIIELLNIGDITYKKDIKELLPYLNLNNDTWYNPETGEKSNESIIDLWNKSIEVSLETIDDINDFLYKNKTLNNYYINNDISYNTGIECNKGQHFTYIRKKINI